VKSLVAFLQELSSDRFYFTFY